MSPKKMSDNIPYNYEEHWYALKVFYNRVSEIEGYLKQENVQVYVPLRYTESISGGKKQIKQEPAISSLLFLRQTEQYVLELQNRMKSRCPLMAYFNRESKKPAVIPEKEMNAFILITSSGDTCLEYFSGEEYAYRSGDRVRVTEGIFKGAEGYIKRIKGNRRLVVSVEGVIAVATTYIPACFLEKI